MPYRRDKEVSDHGMVEHTSPSRGIPKGMVRDMKTIYRMVSALMLVALCAALIPSVTLAGPPPPKPKPVVDQWGVAQAVEPVITYEVSPSHGGHYHVGDVAVIKGTVDFSGGYAAAYSEVEKNNKAKWPWATVVGTYAYADGFAIISTDGQVQATFLKVKSASSLETGFQDKDHPDAYSSVAGPVYTFEIKVSKGSEGTTLTKIYADQYTGFNAYALVDGKWTQISNWDFASFELFIKLYWQFKSEWWPGNHKVVLNGFPLGYKWFNIRRLETLSDGSVMWLNMPSGRPRDTEPSAAEQAVGKGFNYELFLDPQGRNPGVYTGQGCNEKACTEWRQFSASPAPFVGADAYQWSDLPVVKFK